MRHRPLAQPSRPLAALSLLITLVLLVCGGLAGCSRDKESEVWILGLDGADWDVLDPMLAKGELPNIAALRQGGASGQLLSEAPMLSPILWNTIATGKSPDQHGVTWFMTDAPDGTKIPISSRNRWVRAIWDIASQRNLPVGVIGWWATWPVDPVNGFMVSDYVGWHSFGISSQAVDVPGKTWPADLLERVKQLMPPLESIPVSQLQEMVHLPADRLAFDPAADPYSNPMSHLRQAVATARGFTNIAVDQLKRHRPRFFGLYYEGTDGVQHLFMDDAPPQQPWISDEDYAAYKDAVERYWMWQDKLLGEVLAERRPNTTVFVVSDHGVRQGNERLHEAHATVATADQSHMPDGVIIINGPMVRAGARIEGATIYDVAPTVLHLLGLPVPKDMKGRVLSGVLDGGWTQAHPVASIDTYETGPWKRGADVAVDPKAGKSMERMLKSLGYIAGGADSSAEASRTAGNVEQAVNLSVILRKQGKMDQAAAELGKVLKEQPKHVEARVNLAQVYAEMGRLPEAESLYRQLLDEDPGNLLRRQDLALALAHQGKSDEALKVFEEGLKTHPDWALGLAGKGFALDQLGKPQQALVEVEKAIQIDPRLSRAHYYHGLVLLHLGQLPQAKTALDRAHELDPTDQLTLVQMAEVQERMGDIPGAIASLRQGMAQVQPGPEMQGRLGALLLMSGDAAGAKPLLETAVKGRPDDANLLGNYAMSRAMTGDMSGAIESFEKVVRLQPKSAEAQAQLAVLYGQAGRAADAESRIREALKLDPNNGSYHLNLGMIYHGTGRLAEAEKEYREAIRLEPNKGAFHYQLALLLANRGDMAAAQASMAKARALDPSLPLPGSQGGPPGANQRR